MKMVAISQELSSTSYPGRGIIIGRSADGSKAVTAYFIMGRSVNSRNRVFVEDGEGIRTEAFDPSKLEDPSLIIYASLHSSSLSEAVNLSRMHRITHLVFLVSCMWRMQNSTMPCLF